MEYREDLRHYSSLSSKANPNAKLLVATTWACLSDEALSATQPHEVVSDGIPKSTRQYSPGHTQGRGLFSIIKAGLATPVESRKATPSLGQHAFSLYNSQPHPNPLGVSTIF